MNKQNECDVIELAKEAPVKILEKYPELAPSEIRKRVKTCEDIQKDIDGYIDEGYSLQEKMKEISKNIARCQLLIKAKVFNGLTKEDDEKLRELKGEKVDKS